ncbi:MAG: peptidase domain-containing ABC transporter [Gammaproteobacteria bacterium]|nr:peptidase domain-containing ABC transporter [Gammaproteobacteria bacterium]
MSDSTTYLSEQDLPLSEQLCNAIREGRVEDLDYISPYAACIIPLLSALGWRSYQRELIEALPHYVDHLDLTDLRNLLVTLGYESDQEHTTLDNVNEDLLPALFISDQNEIWVVQEKNDDHYLVFDANLKESVEKEIGEYAGEVCYFTDMHPTHALPLSNQNPESWFGDTVSHFKKLIKHLLAMTFVLNIIALAVPLFIMVVYDNVIGARSTSSLPYLIGGLSVALCIELVLRILRSKTIGMVAGRLDYIIGVETLKKLLYLPPQLTERATVSSQLSRLKQFESVRDLFSGSAASLFLELPFVIFFIAILALLAGEIAIVPVVMVVLYAIISMIFYPGLSKDLKYAGQARTARQRMLMDTFLGMRELKALGAEATWKENFREVSGQAMSASYKTAMKHSVINSVSQSLMTLAGIAVLTIGTLKVMNGEITIGILIAVMALLWRVLSPLQGICLSMLQIDQVVQSVKQLNQLMKLNTETVDSKTELMMPEIEGNIRFDRVSFRYGPKSDAALLGASIDIAANEFVAIVGDNGSGKSTILKLIAGMYRAQSGVLAIDGTDVRQFNAIDLRRLIAYVPQKPSLFKGTIAQNLRLTNPLATNEEIVQAAREADVLDTIEALPDGFNTVVGENSSAKLSASLVHGICLARAYIRHAPILLMDEPAESLDMVSDRRLIKQLSERKGKQTIVMVTHRPSHVQLADRVVVISEGVIKGIGTPQEVMKALYGAKNNDK